MFQWIINQSINRIMNPIECLFQSFEGAGSIYITSAQAITAEQLKRYSARAIIHINGQKKVKNNGIKLSNLRQISIKVEDSHQNLQSLFINASRFISESRKSTNIMVWCPQNRELAAVFVFAHLVIRYGYEIDYIWRLYDQRITNICLSQSYIQQLRNLSKKQSAEEEANKKLLETKLGRRILRIRKNYAELAKDSHRDWASEKKTNRNSEQTNPQKTSRRGLSELDYIQSCQSQPSTRFRERSSTGSEIRTHRNIFKSFDLAD